MTEIKLSNGIPVILQNYDGLVSSIQWWVQVGSADENPDEYGFAHFLEHMLFKDGGGKMAKEIESYGGEINAYTSFDQTVYYTTCAEQHWEKVIDVFGTIANQQKFLKSDFDMEREVILEELKKNEDSPSRQFFQSLFSSTFSKHPYGRPVIGFTKGLKSAKHKKLEKFLKNHYVPERMGLVLVGPINSHGNSRKKSLLKTLEKRFGHAVIKPRKPLPRIRKTEAPLRKSINLVKRTFDVQSPSVAFSFRVPQLAHDDMPALDLLASALGQGELSRLYQKLFYQSSLVTEEQAIIPLEAKEVELYPTQLLLKLYILHPDK